MSSRIPIRIDILLNEVIQFTMIVILCVILLTGGQLFAQEYSGNQANIRSNSNEYSNFSHTLFKKRKHYNHASRVSNALIFIGMSSNSSDTDALIFNITYYKKIQKRTSLGLTLNIIGGPAGFLLDEPNSFDLGKRNNDIVVSQDQIVVFDDLDPPDTSSLGSVVNHALKYNVWSHKIELSLLRENIIWTESNNQVGIVYGISAGFILFRPNYYVITERYTYFREEQFRSRGDSRNEGWYYFDTGYTKERRINIVPKVKIVGGYRVKSLNSQYGIKLAVELLVGYQFSGSVTKNTKTVDYLENLTAHFNGVFLTTNFGLGFN